LLAVGFAVAWGLAASMSVLADDGAASIAAGGLVPRRETRIVMAKEVLRISEKKIVVDYDFRNDTDENVTAEVAFPVPPYEYMDGEANPAGQNFASFKVWVDGIPIQYRIEAKATVGRTDVTDILEADHIDIPTFGHFDEASSDISRLSANEKKRLTGYGICDKDCGLVLWFVHLQYHWPQIFPAHSSVHIRHEYRPAIGMSAPVLSEKEIIEAGTMPASAFKPDQSDLFSPAFLATFCPGLPLVKNLAASVHQQIAYGKSMSNGDEMLGLHWVDFILTTANTWQRPIEDFTLIVERPQPEGGWRSHVSFCSPANGKVEKLDADHFQVHLTNFVPTSELHIGFFEVPQAKAAQPAAKK